MTLESAVSKTVYKGNGATKTFSFAFKVWEATEVKVFQSVDGVVDEDVTSAVSVTLSATGGSVTFATAPAAGTSIAIVRNMPFLQEDRYITGSRFDAHEIEEALDIACAERQQLLELANRHLTVPSTSEKTPSEVMTELLNVADKANEYAEQARETYEAAVLLKDTVEQQVTQTGAEQVELVTQTGADEVFDVTEAGETWQNTVEAEGQIQLDRLAGYADMGALANGFAAALQVWTLTEDVPAGSTIILPNELRYIPKHNHLWLSYGGMVLSPTWFTEIGESNATSNEFIINTDLKAGQELMAWVIPLGKAYEVELTDRIVALEEAFADLSRRVVYADTESNTNGDDA